MRHGSLEAEARPQVSFLCMKNALSGRIGVMHKKVNAPEGLGLAYGGRMP